ncbi:MAG: hypothetical protein JXP34_26350 [Planctomycetes bacterium]|nr:hypothetical protein [Planctomycetota bacterium]
MGPHEVSANGLRRLQAEILADLDATRRVVSRANDLLAKAPATPGEAECMAFSGFLHHIYTGIEGIFERIALALDGSVPGGPRWHRDLKRAMALEMAGIRPAVLREETVRQLEEYLAFRHFFRHAYAIEPDWTRIGPLVRNLPSVFAMVEQDLHRFLDGVSRCARDLDGR